jgi:hypothetical protein
MVGFPCGFWSAPAMGGGGGGSYVNSVQHVSITIPSGATSATATISTVGSTALILFNGFQATAATNTATAYARVELTNTTTVTAYRNSSSTDTVTVKCAVVDATSSLIKTVQSGTISITSGNTSGSATISSVNSSYTVVHLLGYINSQTSLSLSNLEPLLTISGTTVTASRQFSGNSQTVGFIVIEFQSAACNSTVQSIQKSWTNTSSSISQSITSVTAANSLVIYAGGYGNSASNESNIEQYAALTNGTTVTISTNAAGFIGVNYNFFVVEFASGVLKSSVQRGTTTLTSVSSNTSTISSVTTSSALLNFLHYTSSQTTANIANVCANAALTNGTTVTVSRNSSTNNVSGSWEVAEFN